VTLPADWLSSTGGAHAAPAAFLAVFVAQVLPLLAHQTEFHLVDQHFCPASPFETSRCCPALQVIHEKLGIVHGCITTIHNLTNTQVGNPRVQIHK
jgi:hypothetical protein